MTNYDLILENEDKFSEYNYGEKNQTLTVLPKFNSINIIIGANNSGKSRFMRNLMEAKDYIGINNLEEIKIRFREYDAEVVQMSEHINQNLQTHVRRLQNTYYVVDNTEKNKVDVLRKNALHQIGNNFTNANTIVRDNKIKLENLRQFNIVSTHLSNFSVQQDYCHKFSNNKIFYIPTLRSAHSLYQKIEENNFGQKFKKIEEDLFLHTHMRNYNLSNHIEIFTGLHLYREILNSRNSEKAIRVRFEKFENFLSENFFDGKHIDIVAKFDKNENEKGINESELILIHVEGEKETRKLYDLGDGVQAIIVLMYKIFMADNDSFIFIDEPELNLHPGMQRLFLQQISKNKDLLKKKLRYIISTHSNHFLDLAIEMDKVSIYSFAPQDIGNGENKFLIKNVNRGDNTILHDLGVNNSSVFMANCSIWVEGVSDRNYIKLFLKSYLAYLLKNDKTKYVNIKEDIDYAFFEYAGSNIDHYIFEKDMESECADIVLHDIKAFTLSNRIYLLADSDCAKSNSKKGMRLKALENLKSDNFYPKIQRNVREIENLFTNKIWEIALISLCNKKLLKSHKEKIEKKIIETLSKIKASSYSKKYIGEFLAAVREDIGKISAEYILNQSSYEINPSGFGTLKNKRDLSEFIFSQNLSWDLLKESEEIENLTIGIYQFIVRKHVDLI